MAEDVVIPKALIIPTRALAAQATAGMTGELAVSGATLIFYNGSAWKSVTTN